LRAAAEVKSLIEEEGLNFNVTDEVEFLKLLRFLRARKFNVAQTMEMIRKDVEWRHEQNRISLRHLRASDVIDSDLSQVYKYCPAWFQGYDKQGRPVVFRCLGKFESWNLNKITTVDKLIEFHAWEMEQLVRLAEQKSKETGTNVETFTIVIDAGGFTFRQATPDAFAFAKKSAVTDNNHYPERLGTIIVINAPAAVVWAWRIAQNFVDEVTVSKVKMVGCNPKEWQPVLFSLIDKEQIPEKYGGLARNLTPEEEIETLNPPPGLAIPLTKSDLEFEKNSSAQLTMTTINGDESGKYSYDTPIDVEEYTGEYTGLSSSSSSSSGRN
jgi:hypothetical protein